MNKKGTDQTARMCRLFCAFPVRKPVKAGFLALMQICNMINFNKFLRVDANNVEPNQSCDRQVSRQGPCGEEIFLCSLFTVKSRKFEVLGTRRFFFRIIRSLNYRGVDTKIYNPQNDCFQRFFFYHFRGYIIL